jgi:chorismate mutase
LDAAASPSTCDARHADALSSPQQVLTSLRDELDGIDRALLDTLRARLALCCRIGAHKARHAIAMMQPHRIGIVQARAADFAKLHGIDPAFLQALYELIIAETCRLEDEVIARESEAS